MTLKDKIKVRWTRTNIGVVYSNIKRDYKLIQKLDQKEQK